jgi:hypothetical protein
LKEDYKNNSARYKSSLILVFNHAKQPWCAHVCVLLFAQRGEWDWKLRRKMADVNNTTWYVLLPENGIYNHRCDHLTNTA